MREIKLVELREDCGGCPTSYSGKTESGQYFETRLRWGIMTIKIDNYYIVNEDVSDEFDGICTFMDFQRHAKYKGYLINKNEAKYSSFLDDIPDIR